MMIENKWNYIKREMILKCIYYRNYSIFNSILRRSCFLKICYDILVVIVHNTIKYKVSRFVPGQKLWILSNLYEEWKISAKK